jgi:hypothetical protein
MRLRPNFHLAELGHMSAFSRTARVAGCICILAWTAIASSAINVDVSYPESLDPPSLPSIVASAPPDRAIQLVGDEEPLVSAPGVDGNSQQYTDTDVLGIGGNCQPTCLVSAGAVILHRSRPDATLLVREYLGPSEISRGDDFGFGWDAGPELTVARRMASGDFWEVRYFNDTGADSTERYGNPVNFQLGNFANISATNLTGQYTTTLHSTEINWRHPWSDRCTLLAGFRWLEVRDRLRYAVTFPLFDADYDWDQHNHLYGGQIGTDLDLWKRNSRLKINAGLKAGVFGEVADNDFALSRSNAPPIDGGDQGDNTAVVGEIGLTGAYLITPHVAVHAGYQLLWIDNLALASDQAAAATATFTQDAIDVNGKLFYHGATAGVDLVW